MLEIMIPFLSKSSRSSFPCSVGTEYCLSVEPHVKDWPVSGSCVGATLSRATPYAMRRQKPRPTGNSRFMSIHRREMQAESPIFFKECSLFSRSLSVNFSFAEHIYNMAQYNMAERERAVIAFSWVQCPHP